MKHLFTPLAVLLTALLASCASSSHQLVPMPAQDVEITDGSVARIYFVRVAQPRGSARAVRVVDGKKEIGTIGLKDYLCWERNPGRSLVTVIFEGSVGERKELESLVDLQCSAGEVHYYGVTLRRLTGEQQDAGKPQIERLSAEDGRALVSGRRPASTD